mmetsp:Transcript_32222/g.84324  ORF Transcript_32222/g.84324 Transcript_32222/m.84324 type:complete len:205 (+) Transcript_32222:502-1116(+)
MHTACVGIVDKDRGRPAIVTAVNDPTGASEGATLVSDDAAIAVGVARNLDPRVAALRPRPGPGALRGAVTRLSTMTAPVGAPECSHKVAVAAACAAPAVARARTAAAAAAVVEGTVAVPGGRNVARPSAAPKAGTVAVAAARASPRLARVSRSWVRPTATSVTRITEPATEAGARAVDRSSHVDGVTVDGDDAASAAIPLCGRQ